MNLFIKTTKYGVGAFLLATTSMANAYELHYHTHPVTVSTQPNPPGLLLTGTLTPLAVNTCNPLIIPIYLNEPLRDSIELETCKNAAGQYSIRLIYVLSAGNFQPIVYQILDQLIPYDFDDQNRSKITWQIYMNPNFMYFQFFSGLTSIGPVYSSPVFFGPGVAGMNSMIFFYNGLSVQPNFPYKAYVINDHNIADKINREWVLRNPYPLQNSRKNAAAVLTAANMLINQ